MRHRPLFLRAVIGLGPGDDVAFVERLDIAVVAEQVGAEQRPRLLLEQQARVPAVRHVLGLDHPEPVAAGLDPLVLGEHARLADREVADRGARAHEAAHGLGPGREREPVVERGALVGLEMAEPDPADRRGIEDGRRRLADFVEEAAQVGVVEQRLLVAHQEAVELEIRLRIVRRQPEDIGRDLGDLGHNAASGPAGAGERFDNARVHVGLHDWGPAKSNGFATKPKRHGVVPRLWHVLIAMPAKFRAENLARKESRAMASTAIRELDDKVKARLRV